MARLCGSMRGRCFVLKWLDQDTSRLLEQAKHSKWCCRCGAAESSLVARNHHPTKSRSPERTTGDTRIVAWWNLRANVTDDENEWRTAQWRTRKAGRALADSWRQRKSVSGTGARRRGQQISTDLVQVREKSASMNGSVMRQQDSARSGFVTTSSAEASLLIWSRQECRSEGTQFPIATPAICGPPQKAGELRPGQGSHNSGGKECLLLGHRTGISLTILRDVSSDGVGPCQHVLLSQHRSHTTCRRNCSNVVPQQTQSW